MKYFLWSLALVLLPLNAHAQDYLTAVLSNIPKSYQVDAMASLNSYKANMLACLMSHEGQESNCASIQLPASTHFTYGITPPQNGSKAWAVRATAKPQNGLSQDDQIQMSSDRMGQITCHGMGKFAQAC
jgi:hypothetical protein